MGSGRFYGIDEPSFTYAPYGDEGGGYYETTTFKTYGNGTYYGATQPTYSFAENGSGGPGYYETVTSVTEGSERILERLSHSRSMRIMVLRAQGIITQLLLMEPPWVPVFIMGLMSLRMR